MEPLFALIAIIAVFVGLTTAVAYAERLTFLAPKSTQGISASAQHFCTEQCRQNGRCPMTGSEEAAADCPLFKYVAADVPTAMS